MFNIFGNISPLFGQLMPRMCLSFAGEAGAGGGDAGDGGAGGGDAGDDDDGGAGGDGSASPAGTGGADPAPAFSWKSQLGEDLSKAPLLASYEDTPAGLAKAVETHINLEKLLGNEKVPLPKDADDVEGIAFFNKAIGVPETADGYQLPDPEMPDGIPAETFDKGAFQEVIHKFGLRPDQAEGLWDTYTKMANNVLLQGRAKFNEMLDKNVNALRAEWGDAFSAKVELGDMVINKFAGDQETGDWLTATLGKDPRGMKFLAKIGSQFSENKIGEFQYKSYARSPEEAQAEINAIKANPNHPYMNESAPKHERDAAINHVNNLIAITMGKRS